MFKAKLYALIAALFAGIMGVIYAIGNSSGKAKERDKVLNGRIDGMKEAQKVEKEIDDADRDTVIDINSKP